LYLTGCLHVERRSAVKT